MAARSTSKKAFKEIIESDYLSKMQRNVLEHLYTKGNCTAAELFYHMKESGAFGVHRNPTHSNIATRLGELRDMQAVSEKAKRKCQISGRHVLTWDLSGKRPHKYAKLSKKEKKEKVLAELRLLWDESNPGNKRRITKIAKMVKDI